MPGVGQQFLPKPQFSSDNPYWIPLWKFPHPKLAAQMKMHTGQDFLYANTWERTHMDPHMAYCVRTAMQRTVNISWAFDVQRQIKNLLLNQKETQSAKTV